MRYLLIILLFTSISYARTNCEKHPIYCQILNNKPNINKTYAMELSNSIYKYSKKHKVNARILTAIFRQESTYNVSAKNCQYGVVEVSKKELIKLHGICLDPPLHQILEFDTKKCINNIKPYKRVKVCFDFGLSQINHKTAKSFGFDLIKLTTDLDCSVEAGAIVLADFYKRYGKREYKWWSRYNSSNPVYRETYEKLVERFM